MRRCGATKLIDAASPERLVTQGLPRAAAAAQGSDLDAHAKQWRLFADVFNNVGAPRAALSGRAKPHVSQAVF